MVVSGGFRLLQDFLGSAVNGPVLDRGFLPAGRKTLQKSEHATPSCTRKSETPWKEGVHAAAMLAEGKLPRYLGTNAGVQAHRPGHVVLAGPAEELHLRRRLRVRVDVKVILTPPCIFCMDNC